MNEFLFFIAIATSIIFAVQVLKNVWIGIIGFIQVPSLAKVPFGYIVPVGLGLWAIFAYGTGLLHWLGIEYVTPEFKYFDIFTTGMLVSGGSNYLYDWVHELSKAKETLENPEIK